MLLEYANDRVISDIDFDVLQYSQPPSTTLTQYDVELYVKSCKAANIYNESIVTDISIEGIDSFICSIPRE